MENLCENLDQVQGHEVQQQEWNETARVGRDVMFEPIVGHKGLKLSVRRIQG